MKPTLLVLAAGMGSRYGGLKQLDDVGPAGETIIDYAVYDAIQAGFGKVVFVIRESFETAFREQITGSFKDQIPVHFVHQEVNTPIEGIDDLPERSKPWGTAHAVLMAADVIQEPFAVVNADDFYGRGSFESMSVFLSQKAAASHYCMVGFVLKNTLSKNGSVSRGVCSMDADNLLQDVVERTKIQREGEQVFFVDQAKKYPLSEEALVSMNLWGFHPSIFAHIHQQFIDFVAAHRDQPKEEFYIPLVVNQLLQTKQAKVSVLPSNEQWYGVTYKEDKESVQNSLFQLAEQGRYPNPIWGES